MLDVLGSALEEFGEQLGGHVAFEGFLGTFCFHWGAFASFARVGSFGGAPWEWGSIVECMEGSWLVGW